MSRPTPSSGLLEKEGAKCTVGNSDAYVDGDTASCASKRFEPSGS